MASLRDTHKSVQFLGIKNAVLAYRNCGLPNWAIVCGNDFLECYEDNNIEEGAGMLTTYLDALAKSQSNGIYQLRVYEKVPKGGKIRIKTESDRSFRFTLQEERSSSLSGEAREILERLERIEARQAVEINDLAGEEKKTEGIGAMLSGLMDQPEVKQALGIGIAKIIEMFITPLTGMNMNQFNNQPAAIGNAGDPDEQVKKVQAAIEILWKVDNKLGDHLAAIAEIAARNPQKYHSLIAML